MFRVVLHMVPPVSLRRAMRWPIQGFVDWREHGNSGMEYKGLEVKEFLIVVFVMFVANCAITVIEFAFEYWY